MKLGPLEGTTEEIKNFFQDNGLQAKDYLAQPESPISAFWLLVPGVLLLNTIAALIFLTQLSKPAATFIFLIGCASALWLAVGVHLRFKNSWASSVIALGCLLLMLVAYGAVTPLEMFQEVKSLKK